MINNVIYGFPVGQHVAINPRVVPSFGYLSNMPGFCRVGQYLTVNIANDNPHSIDITAKLLAGDFFQKQELMADHNPNHVAPFFADQLNHCCDFSFVALDARTDPCPRGNVQLCL